MRDEATDGVVQDPNLDGDQQQQAVALALRPTMGMTHSNSAFTGQISFPWLKLAHGVGGLAQKGFAPDTLVLGEDSEIYSPPSPRTGSKASEPLGLIILDYREYFKQYLSKAEFEAKIRPQVFATAQEAHKAGFTTDWDPVSNRPPTAPAAMTWLTLIEQPQGLVSELFCIEAAGKMYAPAYMSLDKSAYLSVRDQFGMAVRFTLRNRGVYSVVWNLSTTQRTSKTGNVNWVPVIKLRRAMPDDEIAAVLGAIKGEAPPAPADE